MDMVPGTAEYLLDNKATGYIGFDPTASSLHIGSLVQIILLKTFQQVGHQPIAVMGGATGMIGDPSGKSAERNLLSQEDIEFNVAKIKDQLSKFLDFGKGENEPLLVNNYDFYKDMNVLSFLRDVGKHLTLNYMMAKDSVKSRLETGISFTEFSYQLLQAYDFYQLNKQYNCKVQMGGSDQWGNILSGVELIRRMDGEDAYAVTSPLITKSDGTKFGKTEEGNVYLDPTLTSPYKFYQFWLNVSDEDAEKFIKIFTFIARKEILELTAQHKEAPHQRMLQKKLAEEVTTFVHSEEDYAMAVKASEILFGKATKELLQSISGDQLLQVFEGVPTSTISREAITDGLNILDCLTEQTTIFPSRGELRRTIQGGGLSINKEKVPDDSVTLSTDDLLNDRYVLVQKGKKNYYLIIAE